MIKIRHFFKKFSTLNSLPAGRQGQLSIPKGFTMVELLMYMGILSVLLAVLSAVFVSIVDVRLESEATSSVDQDGRYILAKLAYDMHRAQNVTIPASLGGSGSTLQLTVSGVSYTYIVDGNGNLTLTNNLGTNNLNSYDSSISGFSVRRLGNAGEIEDTVRVSFTITSRVLRKGGAETRNFQTTLALRRQ